MFHVFFSGQISVSAFYRQAPWHSNQNKVYRKADVRDGEYVQVSRLAVRPTCTGVPTGSSRQLTSARTTTKNLSVTSPARYAVYVICLEPLQQISAGFTRLSRLHPRHVTFRAQLAREVADQM